MNHHQILLLLLPVLLSCIMPNTPPQQARTDSLSIRLQSLGIDTLRQPIQLRISKAGYTLTVWYDSLELKTYPVVFGGDPVGDKRQEGDRRTPEGKFGIRNHYPHAKWTYFIWIDYPTEDSWRKHKAAKEKGEIPTSATIGGEIGIHGVPQGYDAAIDLRQNWTLGCISMKNADLMEIVPLISKETVVWIE